MRMRGERQGQRQGQRWVQGQAVGPRRLPGLDVLRALMVLAVTGYHLSVWTELFPSGSWANMAFAKLGNFSVSGFFLLSGLLLFRFSPWDTLVEEGLGRFYLRRWLRLAPLFYLAVALNLVLGLGMGPGPSLRVVLENLSLGFGAIHPNHALVTGGWYVGLVALLYAFYPALAWAIRRYGPWLLPLLALGAWIWSLGPTLKSIPALPQAERFHAYVQPGNQVFLFFLGGLLALAVDPLRARLNAMENHGRRLGWLRVAVIVLLLGGFFWHRIRFYDHFEVLTGWTRYGLILLTAGLVLVAALSELRWGRWLKPCGVWSYGAYLLHPFIHRLGEGMGLQGWGAFGMALLLTFLLAALAHRLIERPLGKLA